MRVLYSFINGADSHLINVKELDRAFKNARLFTQYMIGRKVLCKAMNPPIEKEGTKRVISDQVRNLSLLKRTDPTNKGSTK